MLWCHLAPKCQNLLLFPFIISVDFACNWIRGETCVIAQPYFAELSAFFQWSLLNVLK